MKFIFTLLNIFIATVGFSQSLTGIWRGYFLQKNFDMSSGQFLEDKYKYEIQLNNLTNNAIEGVTYSYKTTLFYGKAASQGIFTKKTKNLLLKETRMLELKISDHSVACLMTCYLDYSRSKDGKKQTLTGTYTSVNERNGSDCGSGTVYLEKVITTEFEKEDFLVNKPKAPINNRPDIITKKQSQAGSKKPDATQPIKKDAAGALIKPGAEHFFVKKNANNKSATSPKSTPKILEDSVRSLRDSTVAEDSEVLPPVPEILQKRENVLSNTLVVDAQDVTIEFFDNGQIDGDTISVYHNNRVVVDRKRLGYSPITMQVHIDEKSPNYEFIAVAENLGNVPPNTALVIISSGSKHYEINITSDEQRNAKILLQYQKPPKKQP